MNSSSSCNSAIAVNKKEMKANTQDSDDIMMKSTEDYKEMLESAVTSIMYYINILKPLPAQMDSPKPPWPRITGGLYH